LSRLAAVAVRAPKRALTRIGPARVPSRESPEAAVELLRERGYTTCEIDFEGKFWMDYPWAERFGELAREADIALSVHAPIAGGDCPP
jgi:endonuclease IV